MVVPLTTCREAGQPRFRETVPRRVTWRGKYFDRTVERAQKAITMEQKLTETVASCKKQESGKSGCAAAQPDAIALRLANRLLEENKSEATVDILLDMDLSHSTHWTARDLFTSTPLCKNIVLVMKAHPESPTVQYKSCRLMMKLTFGHKRNKVLLSNAGAVKSIVAAMKTFPFSQNVQHFGCGALRNLMSECAQIIGEVGGVEAIISAMNTFLESKGLQENACTALYNLLNYQNGELATIALETGVGAPLAAAHHRYVGDHDKIATFASEALKLLYRNEL